MSSLYLIPNRVATASDTHHNLNVLVQILAGGGKGLRGGIFKVPQFVLHAAVELVWILLALQVELDANCSILCRR